MHIIFPKIQAKQPERNAEAIYAKEKFAEFKDEMKSEVKFGRAKPTCLKKNKEGLWEYAPSEMKAILKRQMFNMKRN